MDNSQIVVHFAVGLSVCLSVNGSGSVRRTTFQSTKTGVQRMQQHQQFSRRPNCNHQRQMIDTWMLHVAKRLSKLSSPTTLLLPLSVRLLLFHFLFLLSSFSFTIPLFSTPHSFLFLVLISIPFSSSLLFQTSLTLSMFYSADFGFLSLFLLSFFLHFLLKIFHFLRHLLLHFSPPLCPPHPPPEV